MRTAEVLIGWRFPHDRFADRAPHLRWIQMTGAGIEHVMPLDWLPPEATLTNNAGVHAFKAGEFIAMGILALNTRLPFFATNKERRRWDKFFATAVPDKTLVVIGVGHMGTAGAERAKGLGMRVIGVRASGRPSPHVDEMVTPDRLHEVLPRAEILLVSVPAHPRDPGPAWPARAQFTQARGRADQCRARGRGGLRSARRETPCG